eukprot:4441809-Alexandrium_andersonii.AAC.1
MSARAQQAQMQAQARTVEDGGQANRVRARAARPPRAPRGPGPARGGAGAVSAAGNVDPAAGPPAT